MSIIADANARSGVEAAAKQQEMSQAAQAGYETGTMEASQLAKQQQSEFLQEATKPGSELLNYLNAINAKNTQMAGLAQMGYYGN